MDSPKDPVQQSLDRIQAAMQKHLQGFIGDPVSEETISKIREEAIEAYRELLGPSLLEIKESGPDRITAIISIPRELLPPEFIVVANLFEKGGEDGN